MKRYFLLLSLLISTVAFSGQVAVVEIANFFCPECYAVHQVIEPLVAKIAAKKGVFDFVPIAYGKSSMWPTSVYLSLPKVYQKTARNALFTAAVINGMKMQTASQACVSVNDVIPHYGIETCVKRANAKLVGERLYRLQQLLKRIGNTVTFR